MGKIRLKFNNISEIVGTMGIGVIVLTDEALTRQISITCDEDMIRAFGLRMAHAPGEDKLLAEATGKLLKETGHMLEVYIFNLTDGQYRTLLIDNETKAVTNVRASDGVLMALANDLPIYIDEALMNSQSTPFDTAKTNRMSLPINALTDEMLQMALDKSIKDEDYKMAEYLNEELKRRKSKET